MLFDSIKELALHAQNAVENACISAKVAMGPTKSYDEIGSTDNSKGCESDNNEAKASIDNTDTLPHPSKKSVLDYFRESAPEVDIIDIFEFNSEKEKKETQTQETSKKEETKVTKPKEEKKQTTKETKTVSSEPDEKASKGADRVDWKSNPISEPSVQDGHIDLYKVCENLNKMGSIDMGFQNPVQQPLYQQQGYQQFMGGQQPVMQQPIMQQQVPPMQQPMNPIQQPVMYQGFQPIIQQGAQQPMHRVDENKPQQTQKQKPQKQTDKIDSNIDLHVDVLPEEKDVHVTAVDPSVVELGKKIIQNTPIEVTAKYDNSVVKTKYPYLQDVENVALKNGCQVKMMERIGANGNSVGLIDVYTEVNDIVAEKKSFTIDTGNIIDKRIKVFPVILECGYEKYQAYPLKDRSKDKNDKQMVFNEELFKNIFVGGVDSLPDRGMYSPERRELNRIVDLISMPTKDMSSSDRKDVMARLEKAYKSGAFTSSNYYKSGGHAFRFRFKEGSFNKNTKTFTLVSTAPLYYNGPYFSKCLITAAFGTGDELKVTTTSK